MTSIAAAPHIVYVLANALNERDFERFGMGFFLERGARVTTIDIATLIHPAVKFDRASFRPDLRVAVRVVESVRRLDGEKAILKAADFIVFVAQSHGPDSRNLAALRLVSRCRRPYLIFSTGALPWALPPAQRLGWIDRLRSASRRIEWHTLLDRVIRRLPLSSLGVAPADFVIHDGRASVGENPLIGASTVSIFAHSFDYEKVGAAMRAAPSQTGTAVFLDQFIPYSQDFVTLGFAGSFDAARYHGALRRLFDQVERDLGLRVVIAAHPRATYADTGIFGRRQVTRGKTEELVRDSSLVIAHSSTAVSYAAIFRKPLLVVATQEMLDLNVVFSGQIRGVAKAFDTPLRLIVRDKDTDLAGATDLDHGACARFIEDFIKVPTSPDAPMWQIVLDAVAKKGILGRIAGPQAASTC